jgi:hypothetical protein
MFPRHSDVFTSLNLIRFSKHKAITHNLDFRFFFLSMDLYLMKGKQRYVLRMLVNKKFEKYLMLFLTYCRVAR